MSFISQETGDNTSSPVECYVFEMSDATYYYTSSASEEVRIGGQKYTQMAIKRSSIKDNSDPFKSSIQLEFPINTRLGKALIQDGIVGVLNVIVRRFHASDSKGEVRTLWRGRATGYSVSGVLVTLSCESAFSSLTREGLRARFTRECRFELYGSMCRAPKNAFSRTVYPTRVEDGGFTLIIPGFAGQNDLYTQGTLVRPDGISLFVVEQKGERFQLSRRVRPDTVVGKMLTASYGCDKTLNTCINKFNNSSNFGGFPYIPEKSPYEGGIV
nr:MAG TPA: minor tail protein [Caudoviricetes sp.]